MNEELESSASPASSNSSSMFPAANAPTPPHSQGLALDTRSVDTDMTGTTLQPSIHQAAGESNTATDVAMADDQYENGEDEDIALQQALGNSMMNKRGAKGRMSFEYEEDEDAPGYIWKNRRAMEERRKAEEQLLDKDFDPLSKLTVLSAFSRD